MQKLNKQQNIPLGWQEKKLVEICDIVNGSTPSTQRPVYWDGDINWYTPNDLKYQKIELEGSERKISEAGLKSIGSKIIPAHSLILSTRAPIGYLGITKTKASFNQGCKGLTPKDNISEFFLYYLLFSKKKALNGLGSGSTFLELSSSSLSSFSTLLPPLKEQQKIAEILSTADEDIAKTQEVIEATEKLKRGLMQQLFTRGIGHTKFKNKKLEELTKVSSGKTPSRSRTESYKDGVVPWVKSTEVRFKTIFDTAEKITEQCIVEEGMKIVPKGAVLMAMYGQGATRGKSAVLGCDATTNQAIASIIPDPKKLLSKYLFYWLVSQYDNLRNLGHGGNQKNLNSQIIKELKIPVCTIGEQQKIAEILSAVDEKISVNKKLKEKLTLLKKGLMQDLLSGRVRVNF